MLQYLDFEKSVAELEGKAEELRVLAKDDPDMDIGREVSQLEDCLLYTSPSPRDRTRSRMPSSA